MKKNIIIIGMGQGLSMGIAEHFGKEGFHIGMMSRSAEKLADFQAQLVEKGITSEFVAADVADTAQMIEAIHTLQSKMGTIDVLQYNAVDYRMNPLMSETADTLTTGFRISVANALAATQTLLPDLKSVKGAVLLTGGGSGNHPNPNMASISLGKAGIRNLAVQLNEVLKAEGVYVGTLTIGGWIQPESETHSPKILAEKFWELYQNRDQVELIY
jgi:short-subunit dehydrogenase